MATYSSAFSMCYHLLVILLLICTIFDVAASVDEDGGEDGEDGRGAIPPPRTQEITDVKRLVDVYRYWATMHTAKEQADASGGDAELDAQLMAAKEALDGYVKLSKDGNASQADKDMAFRVLQEKVKPIEEQFEPSPDQQALIEVGELFVEIAEKWNRGVLPVNTEIYRQLEVAFTKWTTLTGTSTIRKLTPQEREEAAQMKKNLEKILGKSAGSKKGRLRGCPSVTLGTFSSPLPVFSPTTEADRQLEAGFTNGVTPTEAQFTKCDTLADTSAIRKLTSQEKEEAVQIQKNQEMIFRKSSDSAGSTKAPDTGTNLAGRLRCCLSVALGATLLSTFLWLVGRQVFSGQSLDSLASISEAIEYSKHRGTTGQATSSSSTVVPLLATVGLIIVIIGLLLYYFSDRIWPKKATKKRRTTEKCSQVKTGKGLPTGASLQPGGKSSIS